MKEHIRLRTLNCNYMWNPVQKEAKIPECFYKGDKSNQFLEKAFKRKDDRGAEDQRNLVVDFPHAEAGTSVVPERKIELLRSKPTVKWHCCSIFNSVSYEYGKLSGAGVLLLAVIVQFRDLIKSLNQEINNLITEEKEVQKRWLDQLCKATRLL
ncbi:hypothetical protein QOT17_003100 [Balamuthia mandrillaris]